MRLERSRTDIRLFGLCGGIAKHTGIGSGWIRFGLIAGTFLTGGILIFLYILASMVIPKEPAYNSYPYPGGYWYAPAGQAYAFGGACTASGNNSGSGLDAMMQDLEEQAMAREIRELRAKLARYEEPSQS